MAKLTQYIQRLRPFVLYAAVATIALGVAALAIQGPLRQYLAQNNRIDGVRTEIEQLEDANDALRDKIDRLDEDATLERIAREELGLVRPGEEAYVLVPPGSIGPPGETGTPEQPAPQPQD